MLQSIKLKYQSFIHHFNHSPFTFLDLFGAQHYPPRTGLYIESISIQETKSILFFSGDVTAEVADGDQITLDESTVLLNGRGQLSWTDRERCFIGRLFFFFCGDGCALPPTPNPNPQPSTSMVDVMKAQRVQALGHLCLRGRAPDQSDAVESRVLRSRRAAAAEYCSRLAGRWASRYHIHQPARQKWGEAAGRDWLWGWNFQDVSVTLNSNHSSCDDTL